MYVCMYVLFVCMYDYIAVMLAASASQAVAVVLCFVGGCLTDYLCMHTFSLFNEYSVPTSSRLCGLQNMHIWLGS